MRRVSYVRRVVALVIVAALAVSVSARPREERPIREPKETPNPIVKVIKRIVKSLGDGIHIPTP